MNHYKLQKIINLAWKFELSLQIQKYQFKQNVKPDSNKLYICHREASQFLCRSLIIMLDTIYPCNICPTKIVKTLLCAVYICISLHPTVVYACSHPPVIIISTVYVKRFISKRMQIIFAQNLFNLVREQWKISTYIKLIRHYVPGDK